MSTTSTGRQAETAVKKYLDARGFKVIDQNWRRPRCEIDLVAEKTGIVYFVEVKYRRNSAQGSGLEYITSAKLRQMKFAAANWVEENKWRGDYCLSAAEVAGRDFTVESFIDCIE